MPQKNNPDVLELVRARCARVLASAQAVLEILRALPGGYNRDVQETKEPFFEGIATTRATLRILRPLTAAVKVHPDRLRAAFTPDVFAADHALELAAEGVPFREAYRRVKADLAGLAKRDPDESIIPKTHLGAPMGLDFKALRARARSASRFAETRRRAFARAIEKLMHPEE
jgi:argininosuccinate lyase